MDTVINSFVEKSKEILQDNLVGVYLHGSAVMGCYNPAKSDIDLIVVVKESIEDSVKSAFMDMVIDLNEKGPDLEDTAEDARSEIYRAIHRKKKWMAEGVFDRIIGITDKETKRKAVEQAKAYILGNWSGIMLSMKSGNSNVRCSAEGHVSHVYADRMSSRPLGWCRTGADKMSRLRIYRQNEGNMLELVRFQRKELRQVAGAEEIIYSATEMMRMEKANKRKLGVLADLPVYDILIRRAKR